MKTTAPKELGILLIAGVFGFIGGAVAFVAYDFGIAGSILIMIPTFLIVAIVLWLGWREPKVRPMGAGIGPVIPVPASDGGRNRPGTASVQNTSPAGVNRSAVDAPDAARAPVGGMALESRAEPVTEPQTARAGTTATPDPAVASTDTATDANTTAAEADTAPTAVPPPTAAPDPAVSSADTTTNANTTAAEAETAPTAVPPPTAAEETGDAKPQGMAAPRDGGPDDLKQIKGIGPKLEETLHDAGIYHFDQIASWSDREVAWMDENLVGFKGRVSRDDWIPQARVLADGGDTEFSKRVDKGDVHE